MGGPQDFRVSLSPLLGFMGFRDLGYLGDWGLGLVKRQSLLSGTLPKIASNYFVKKECLLPEYVRLCETDEAV